MARPSIAVYPAEEIMVNEDEPTESPRTPSSRPVRRGVRAVWPWLLLLAAVLLWAFTGRGGSGLPDGEAAPALAIPWTEGDGQFALDAHEGQVVVLAFWATWCPACRQEGPVLSRVHRSLEASGDRVVGVSVDDASLEAVAAAARRLGMTYPIALATRADAQRFGVQLLPTIYVIGADGRISTSFTGAVSERTLLDAVEHARGARDSARVSAR